MMTHVAHAGALQGGEAEPRTNGAVGMQAPHADVAIPAGLHLAEEHDLLPLHVDRDAQLVASIGTRVENGCRRRVAEAEARRDVDAGCLDHSFHVLPVAIRTARIAVVLHVQDRNVRAIEQASASIVDKSQLGARAVGAGRRRRPHDE